MRPRRTDRPASGRSKLMKTKRLTLQQRQEIFHELVLTQDAVMNVPRSRQIITEKHDISEQQLKAIEDEGLDNEWPPLSEAVQEQEMGRLESLLKRSGKI